VVNTLTYDANGSITKYDAASGDDTDLVYDGQNNVTSITVGAAPTAKDEFWYDPDGQRFLGQETWQSSGTKASVTVYLGNFEEVVPAAGSDKTLVQRTDLSAGVRHVRVRYASNGTYGAWFEYVHRDHLGSVAVVTSASGTQLIDKLSYDPFGARRRDTWASDITTSGMNSLLANEDVRFARGFTDHEMLNRTGFIHMNGRVYDPRIGRFVSADPIVSAPFHSQSYNRYAYVFNSPVSYTDPSGFVPSEFLFGAIADSSSYTVDLYSAYASRLAKWERKDPDSYKKWLKEIDEEYFRAVDELLRRGIDAEWDEPTVQFDRSADGLWFGFSAGLALEHEAALPALPTVVAIVGSVARWVISRIVSKLKPRARSSADDAATVADDAAESVGRVSETARKIEYWLGPGARTIRNDAGDLVVVSRDGTRRVRFDVNRPYPHENPHAHVEELVNGRWVKSGPIFPKDVTPK
jgi:RHS repeat-associated protein